MKTCKHGHPLTKATIYVSPKGVKQCRECKIDARINYNLRQAFKRAEQAIDALPTTLLVRMPGDENCRQLGCENFALLSEDGLCLEHDTFAHEERVGVRCIEKTDYLDNFISNVKRTLRKWKS